MSESTERVEIQYVLSGLQEFLRGNEAAKGVFGEVIDYLKQAVGELKTISTNIASAMNAIPAAVKAAGQKTTAEIKAMSQANAKIAVEAAKAEAEIIKSKAKASGKVEEIAAKSAADIVKIEAQKNAALEIEQVRSDNKRIKKAKDTASALEKEAKKQARKEYDLLFDRTIDASSALEKKFEKDKKIGMRVIADEMKASEIAKYSGLRNIGTAIAEVARLTVERAATQAAAWQTLRNKVSSAAGGVANSILNIRNAIAVTFASSVIKKIVDFGAEFQQGLAEISTIVDTSVVSMGRLQDGLLELTTRVPQKLPDLTRATYEALSSNINPDDVLRFVETSAKAATAGLATTLQAVDLFTSIVNSYGMRASEVGQISDKIFETIKLGKTTFSELARELGAVASIANTAGMTFDELLASVAALTISGIRTNEAVTAIRNALTKITAPTKVAEKTIAALNKELEGTDKVLHMSAKDLREGGFLKLLTNIREASGGDIKILRKLFEEVTGLNAVLNLSGENFANLERILETIQNASGSTGAAFEKMSNTVRNRAQILRNTFGVVAARILGNDADTLSGALANAQDLVLRNTDAIADWARRATAEIPRIISALRSMIPIIEAIAKMLVAAWALGKASAFMDFIRTVLIPGMAGAATAAKGLAASMGMSGLAGSLGGLATAAGVASSAIGLGLVAAIGLYAKSAYDAMERTREFTAQLDKSFARNQEILAKQRGFRSSFEMQDFENQLSGFGGVIPQDQGGASVGELASQVRDLNGAKRDAKIEEVITKADERTYKELENIKRKSEVIKQTFDELKKLRVTYEDINDVEGSIADLQKRQGALRDEGYQENSPTMLGYSKALDALKASRSSINDSARILQNIKAGIAEFELSIMEKKKSDNVGPDLPDSDGKGLKKKGPDLWAELFEYLKKMRDAMANEYQKILDEQSDFNTKFAKLMDELQRKFPDDYARIAAYFADQYVEVSKKFADNAEAERKKLLQDSGFSKAMEARSTFTDRAIEKTNKFTMESRRLREELEKLESLPKFQIVDEKTRLDLESTLATIQKIIAAYEEMGNLTPVQQQALSGLYGVKYGIENRLSGSQVPLTTDEQIARGVKMRELGLDELKTQLRGQFEEAAKYIPEAFRGAFGDMATEFSDVFVDAAAKGKSAMGAAFEAAGKIAATSLKDAILDIVYSVYDQTRAFYQEVVGSGLFMTGTQDRAKANFAEFETILGQRTEGMPEWERNRAIEDGGLVKNRRERVKALDKGGVANEFVQGVVDKFKNYYANAASNLRGLGQRLPGVLRGLANQMRRQGAQYLRELVNNLPRIMRAAVPAVAQFAANLLQRAMVSLPAMIVYIADMFIVALIRSVPALIRGIPDMVMLLIEALIDQIPLITQELVMMIPDIALAIVEAILRLLTVMPGKLVDSWSEAFTDMLTNQKAWDKFWREATRGIRGMLGDMGDWFERSIFSGVRKAFRRILNWLKGELEDLNPFKKKGGGSGFGVGLGFGAIGVDDDGVDLGIGGHGVRVGGSSGISFYKSGGGIGVGSAANGRMWGSGLDGKSQVNGFLHRLLSFIPQMFGEDYLGAFSHGEITLPTDLTRAIASGSFADQISRAISAAIPTVSAPALAHATGGLGGASIINVNAKNMFARDLARVVDDARFDASKRAGWRTSKNVNAGYKG